MPIFDANILLASIKGKNHIQLIFTKSEEETLVKIKLTNKNTTSSNNNNNINTTNNNINNINNNNNTSSLTTNDNSLSSTTTTAINNNNNNNNNSNNQTINNSNSKNKKNSKYNSNSSNNRKSSKSAVTKTTINHNNSSNNMSTHSNRENSSTAYDTNNTNTSNRSKKQQQQHQSSNQQQSKQQSQVETPPASPNGSDQGSKACCFCWCCCCSCSCLTVRNDQSPNPIDGNLVNPNIVPPSIEEVKSWSETFEKLMQSPAGRYYFREFLRSEYSEENMLFWLACEELKAELSPELIEEKARSVYEDYISILSPKEVSLDSRVREIINRNMVDPTPHTFDEAQLQIYTLMHRDSYPRFLNSQLYKKLCQGDKPNNIG